ncbi:hypothetical protein T05_10755 [Trichinella murrelli]|uniref:Uncharacterized protein n=1 Tax=Trichinella murrelli TaxID=144512 RepID=A0A0V0SNC4_9BILA|nr:hypothetical protein T05_10755 [Trichinella murrelli]
MLTASAPYMKFCLKFMRNADCRDMNNNILQ